MSSNMLTGDRRWAPGRKLTVLGKVPKPINLPSQRLENRGLDPNVEIVPKGTLTWGSKTSASIPNVWGTSSLSSPHTDGSSGSPVNGSGPRPSTAGSDISQEPVSTAWGSTNSRPSSASGIFASSQTSFPANRPRSAETRPGSSQRSRFSENLPESTFAWGPMKAGERVTPPSRVDGFTLSSGDFPTLGAEKSSDSHISKEYGTQGRPTSSGSIKKELLPHSTGMAKADMSTVSGDVNAWNKSSTGVGSHIENWQSASGNLPPQQFDSWSGPPVCPSDGLLHGVDPLVVGPFRPLARTPGCCPVEATSYYPQIPTQFGNPQVAVKIGNVPGDCYLKNEDMFHPHPQSESFIFPNVPIVPARPSMYAGPPTFDAYYGPQLNFSSFSVNHGHGRDTSAASVHNQNSARPGKFSTCSVLRTSEVDGEVVKSDNISVPCQGHFKVLLKQHDGSEDNYSCDKQEQFSRKSQTILMEDQREAAAKDVEWEIEVRKDERPTSSKGLPDKGPSQRPHIRKAKSSESGDTKISSSSKTDNKEITKQSEPDTHLIHDQKRHPVSKKNTALIEKIEVLNNKARIVDSQGEAAPVILQPKSLQSKAVAATGGSLPLSSRVDGVNEKASSGAVGYSLSQDTGAMHEEINHGGHDLKRSGVLASNKIEPCEDVRENSSHIKMLDPSVARSDHPVGVEDELKCRTSERSVYTVSAIADGEGGSSNSMEKARSLMDRNEELQHMSVSSASEQFAGPSTDLEDHEAQRTKFKERALQRIEQLRQEEEERVREQKARALAKLEELDRRTRSRNRESSSNSVGSGYQRKEDYQLESISVKAPCDNSTVTSVAVEPPDHDESKGLVDRSHLSSSGGDGLSVSGDQSLLLNRDADCVEENVVQRDFMDIHDRNLVNKEQIGYQGRQIIAPEEKLVECSVNSKKSDEEILHLESGDTSILVEDRSVQNKKKSVKNARNKNKFNHGVTQGRNLPIDAVNHTSQPEDPISLTVQALHEPDIGKSMSNDVDASSMKRSLRAGNEQQQGRVINQLKLQTSKRSGRNQQTQGNEAVVWAPVKPQAKNSTPEEDVQNNKTETSRILSGNNGQTQTCGTKVKRAEMERYVPKSVAKEISRPENPPLASSATDVTTDSDISKSGSGIPSDVPVASAEMTSLDNYKARRHGKVRASWRQRNPVESNQQDLRISGKVDNTSESVDVVESPCEQRKEESKSKPMEQVKQDLLKDEVENPEPSELRSGFFRKDQGVSSKHRHQRYKAQRAILDVGAHHGPKDLQSGPGHKSNADPPASWVSELGGRGILGVDDRNPGNNEHNRKARWQPKPPAAHVYDVQGESPSLDFSAQRRPEDAIPSLEGIRGSCLKPESNQEGNPIGAVQKQTQSSSVFTDVEPDLPRADLYHRHQHGSLATQRHGQTNVWLSKGQDSTYGGWDEGQDMIGDQNLHPGSNNKRRNGSHFEYQSIGSQPKPVGNVDSRGGSYRGEQQVQNHLRRSDRSYESRSSSEVVRYGGSK